MTSDARGINEPQKMRCVHKLYFAWVEPNRAKNAFLRIDVKSFIFNSWHTNCLMLTKLYNVMQQSFCISKFVFCQKYIEKCETKTNANYCHTLKLWIFLKMMRMFPRNTEYAQHVWVRRKLVFGIWFFCLICILFTERKNGSRNRKFFCLI